MNKRIKRGDIYSVDLDPVTGSEQGNCRPVLVVQNNMGNIHSSTTVIVPITTKLNKKPVPTHVTLLSICGLDADSLVLTEQIRTIDLSRFDEDGYIGHLDENAMSQIDKALLICLGINKEKEKTLFLSLCSRCESNFRNGGYMLVKKGWQMNKTTCDFCNVHKGLIFGVFKGE